MRSRPARTQESSRLLLFLEECLPIAQIKLHMFCGDIYRGFRLLILMEKSHMKEYGDRARRRT